MLTLFTNGPWCRSRSFRQYITWMATLSLVREVTVNFVNRLLLPPRESEAFKWIKPLNRRDHSLSALGSQLDGEPRWTWSNFQYFCPEFSNRSFVLKPLNLIYSVQKIFNWIKLLNRRDHSLSALVSLCDGKPGWTWTFVRNLRTDLLFWSSKNKKMETYFDLFIFLNLCKCEKGLYSYFNTYASRLKLLQCI